MNYADIYDQYLDLMRDIREAKDLAVGNDEARDLALAVTHLEDSWTRYNSARYHRLGLWKRSNPDPL